MVKKLFVLIMALMSLGVQAQSEVGKHPVYCTVMGYNFLGFGKVKVQLDLGRKVDVKGYDSLYDGNGKKIKFKTMVSVLDYMGLRGWKCIDTFFLSEGKPKVLHFLLEKWVSSDEEITEGLELKTDTDEPWKPGKNGDDMY